MRSEPPFLPEPQTGMQLGWSCRETAEWGGMACLRQRMWLSPCFSTSSPHTGQSTMNYPPAPHKCPWMCLCTRMCTCLCGYTCTHILCPVLNQQTSSEHCRGGLCQILEGRVRSQTHSPGPHHAGAKRKYWDLGDSTRYLKKGITEQAIENRGQQSGLVCKDEWGSHRYRTGDRGVRHPQSIQGITKAV